MLSDDIKFVGIKMLSNFWKSPAVLSENIVFDSQESIYFIVDFISNEEISFGDEVVGNFCNGHGPEGKFIVSDEGSIVPGEGISTLVLEINF